MDEAIGLTNLALEREGCKIPINCTDGELDGCIRRAMQLYPEIKELKLFDAYRYLYHASIDGDVLRAAMEMKENCIRVTQGKMNRIGHNWEACVEWFIDHFTSGAEFLTQHHRSVMDP